MELDQLHEGQGHDLSSDRSLKEARLGETRLSSMALTGETTKRQRVAAAMRMGSLATAAHHAAGDLEEQFPQAACYIRDTADGFGSIANLLRDPNLDEVATLIGKLGRKQPAAIVAAVVLVGLGFSWFLTSSGGGAAPGEANETDHGIH